MLWPVNQLVIHVIYDFLYDFWPELLFFGRKLAEKNSFLMVSLMDNFLFRDAVRCQILNWFDNTGSYMLPLVNTDQKCNTKFFLMHKTLCSVCSTEFLSRNWMRFVALKLGRNVSKETQRPSNLWNSYRLYWPPKFSKFCAIGAIWSFRSSKIEIWN